jgi:hypothetical protein
MIFGTGHLQNFQEQGDGGPMMERIAAKPVTTAIHDASMDSATYKLDYIAPVTPLLLHRINSSMI